MNIINIINILFAFLGLLSTTLANDRGHDKKCKEGSAMCQSLGQQVVNVCDNGHFTRLWMCPEGFWCSKDGGEPHCAAENMPSGKQCGECDITMHKCVKNCSKRNDEKCVANCKEFVCKQGPKQCQLGKECNKICFMSFLDN